MAHATSIADYSLLFKVQETKQYCLYVYSILSFFRELYLVIKRILVIQLEMLSWILLLGFNTYPAS